MYRSYNFTLFVKRETTIVSVRDNPKAVVEPANTAKSCEVFFKKLLSPPSKVDAMKRFATIPPKSPAKPPIKKE